MCSSSSHQASLQRHSVFLYRLSFECPTLRLLAGLVDDWQITLKKFLGVRCAQCNSFYRISSLLTTVMLSSLISRNRLVSMHFFLQSFAASISHGSICRCSLVVSDICRYIDCIATSWTNFRFPLRDQRNYCCTSSSDLFHL